MLGNTADSLFWIFRYLERAENNTRLLETAILLSLTSSNNLKTEWISILKTLGLDNGYIQNIGNIDIINFAKFIIKDSKNPNNILLLISKARFNAKKSRVALTNEVWESLNTLWLNLEKNLKKSISNKNLHEILYEIRKQITIVFGFTNETMLRNEILNFCHLGTYIERLDNTARILDVNHYLLLPNTSLGKNISNENQWEILLRSIAAYKAFMWQNQNVMNIQNISNFLMFDEKMPRSLKFSIEKILKNLKHISKTKFNKSLSYTQALKMKEFIHTKKLTKNYGFGLHNFLANIIILNTKLGFLIEDEFKFHN